MEEEKNKQLHRKNSATNGLRTEIPINLSWHVNITFIDLSARNIDSLDAKVLLPEHLVELNISHNKLTEVPAVISKLGRLKKLDLSHNAIEYFNETPNFCNTLERLDMSANNLHGPPYWIWTEKPKNLTRINLSCNTNLTKSFDNCYLEELSTYETLVLEVDLYNCGFKTIDADLLATFSNAKTILFGTADYAYHGANIISEVPNKGLEKCSGIEKLNLSNTHIHTINSKINMLKNLCELHLACNNINGLPNEFCSLVNLETCVLSGNEIIYLPDDMHKLMKLERLYIDSNKLCMLPENFKLPNLKVLDLYDNYMYEVLENFTHLQELDLALNYMDEPDDIAYLEKKEKLRLVHENRCDGRKPESLESEHSSRESDNEEYYRAVFNGQTPDIAESASPENDESRRSSSPEDWDSDAYWIPNYIQPLPCASQGWIHFIKRKMQEGNFCPVDAHVVSVSEQLMYEKKLNLRVEVEQVGQFDDYSSDDS